MNIKIISIIFFPIMAISAPHQGNISGIVLDAYTKKPLPFANVTLQNTSRGAAADSLGRFCVPHLKPGQYTLEAQMIGYEPQTKNITLDASQSLDVEFHLRESFFQTRQVVVTATRSQKLLENVPVVTELITRAEIRESGAKNLAQVLEDRPGITIEEGVSGGKTLRMNGIDGKYILILVDGLPVSGKFNNRTELNFIEADRIERIEIVKGAGSALYGSEAMGGVVNIITRDFSETFQASARAQAGSYDYYNGNFNMSGTHKQLCYLVNADHARGGVNKNEVSMNVTGTQNSGLASKLEYSAPAAGTLSFSAGYNRDIQNGKDPVFYNKTTVERRNASLNWSKTMTKTILNAQGYYTGYDRVYSETVVHSGYLARRDSTGENMLGIKTDYKYRLSENKNLDTGIDYVHTGFRSERVLDNKKTRNQIGIFAQYDARMLKKLNLVLGARYDYITRVGPHLSPRISAMYSPAPVFKIRAAWGGGFRAPSFTDMYIDYNNVFVGYRVEGNPDLKPERSNSATLGLEYFWNYKVLLNANIFHNIFKDMVLDYSTAPAVLSYKNIDHAIFTGVELQSKIYMRKNCSLVLAYNYTRIGQSEVKDEVSNISPHTGLFKLNYSLFKNRVKLTFKDQIFGEKRVREFDRRMGSYGDTFKNKKAYHLMDISIVYRFNKYISLQAGVTNLNDYTDHEYGPWIGQRFFSALELNY